MPYDGCPVFGHCPAASIYRWVFTYEDAMSLLTFFFMH